MNGLSRKEFLQKLMRLDPVRLFAEEKLIRLALILELVHPENRDRLETPKEIVDKYYDDAGDDPDYHGFNAWHVKVFREKYLNQ